MTKTETGSKFSGHENKIDFVLGHAWTILYEFFTMPFIVVTLFYNRKIDRAYPFTWRKKFRLAWRMYRNCLRTMTATSYKAHLAMAAKVLEFPKDREGVIVECGCFLGGSATNLSLVAELTGRDLILYDSFEGLPAPAKGEKYGGAESEGGFRGSIETVKANIARGGNLDVCQFRKGWLKDTLPHHTEPIVLAFFDVDYQASLHDCLINLWEHIVLLGFVFIDEYVLVDYCAVFFSERYWRTYFNTTPPGLHGVGTGIPLGQYYLGPFLATPALQRPSSIAYTFKGNSGHWDYFPEPGAPDHLPATDLPRGDAAR